MQTVPSEKAQAIVEKVMGMQHDFDNGLLEFQESIHYCIYHMYIHGCTNACETEAIHAVQYLRDLAERLRELEEFVN